MDPRLNIAIAESHNRELLDRAVATRAHRVWPDDGRAARDTRVAGPRFGSLHPFAILAALIQHR